MDISLSWDLGINIGHSGYPHEHKDQQGPLYGRRPQQQSAHQQRVKAEITGKREEEMIMKSSQREEYPAESKVEAPLLPPSQSPV